MEFIKCLVSLTFAFGLVASSSLAPAENADTANYVKAVVEDAINSK